MQNSINQRIKFICEKLFNGNVLSMANQIGINRSTLRDIIGEKQSEPRFDTLSKIVDSSYNINSTWLMKGIGEPFNDNSVEVNIVRDKSVTYNDQKGQPFYDVDFVGGFDVMCNDQTIKPAYYIDYKPFNSKQGVMWVNLTGKSMEPELNHGDMIAIKEATTPIEYLPAGEIYAIVTEDFRTVKRISKSDREGFVRLIPSNKSEEYTPQDIPVSIIRKVFYVLGSFKNF